MLLDHDKFVVKSTSKKFSWKKSYDIVDGDTGQSLGSARDVTGFVASLLGATHIDVRDLSNNALLFSVKSSGLLFKKDQVFDGEGHVLGHFKAKRFSLSGGYHVYDKTGKHIGEIQGKMFKAEYKLVTPDRSAEMGTVSRTWGGLAKSLLTGDDSYGVQIAPGFSKDHTVKMLTLATTLAVESIFKKKASKGGGEGEGGGESGGEE